MRRLKNGSGPDTATMPESWTAPRDERLYVRRQMRIARAGIGHVLTGLPRGLPRMIDPRRWIRHHPVASVTVWCATAAAAGVAIRASGPSIVLTWLRGPFKVGSRVVRSAGRTLIGMTLARAFWESG